ncbi:hypothetical protein EW145_g7733 [Phellinidium pouzarii]|uniref:F-box domain-containing protein n=1 Tax=Phellinidium pouzarii TaxID=167371 RepID=A0A4S4KGP1_9AGAM|nr:hypothetical protein EW145_g7733 [Phellinidium pouzarii]
MHKSTANLDLESRSPPSHAAAQLLELYLSRSGDILPLDIFLDYSEVDHKEVNRSNNLSIAEKARREAYSTGMRRLAQILERVRLRWRFLAVSALRSFPAFSYQQRSLTPASGIVFSTLSDAQGFNLQYMSWLDFGWTHSQIAALVWLSSCPNLEHLCIGFYSVIETFSQSYAPPDVLPLTLSHLTDFELALNCSGGDPSSFLDFLIFPGLRKFKLTILEAVQLGPENQWRGVIEFLQRSEGAPLETLKLLGTPLNPQEFMEILQMTPGLRKLVFDGTLATAEILDQLSNPAAITPSIDSEYEVGDINSIRIPLCPRLEKLKLHNYSQPPFALADMAFSRCQHSSTAQARVGGELSLNVPCYSTLKYLIFVGDISLSPSNDPAFQACRDRGLKIIEKSRPL